MSSKDLLNYDFGEIMKTVDIVIPAHNSVHWLSWCLEELFRFESHRLQDILVVDDRSEANQSRKISEIAARYPKVNLIVNESNEGGFGYACNLASSKGSSDAILFLNTDCLLTEGVIDRLCDVFDSDPAVALACPLSNNSPCLTYPMFPGFSYRDMATLLWEQTSESETDGVVEACTVVGNCLMVRRDFFEKVGGFSPEWGMGYGEETDLQMKALSNGLKGVVDTGCYVYHFGGGTFNHKSEIETHRKRNHRLFISKWANEYKDLAARCENIDPVQIANRRLEQSWIERNQIVELDVLFYLPGIDQGVGGINAVIAICNDLIRRGVKASCALVGNYLDYQLEYYKEPVLFNFMKYDSDESFLIDCTVLPKVVFSTVFCSAPVVAKFASDRGATAVQFVQGYEGYFENGTRYIEAIESYKSINRLVTTSNWLFEMVSRHLSPDQDIQQLPLVINTDIFFSDESPRPIDVVFAFRSAPDKGQWILAELLDRLVTSDKTIAVLCASQFSFLKDKYEKRVQFIDLPLDQYSIAKIFRQAKVFVDASLHEGYGLMPLEAALCGCDIVSSDSGGVRDFIHFYKGELIKYHLDLEGIIAAINLKLDNFDKNKTVEAPLMQASSSELWYKYIKQITKDKPSPAFSAKLINKMTTETHALSLNKLDQEINHLSDATNVEEPVPASESALKKFYKSFIFPFIPRRIHLALKKLLSEKV